MLCRMILVTGATGFLGHNLVPRLVEAGYAVRAVVRASSDVTFLQRLGVSLAHWLLGGGAGPRSPLLKSQNGDAIATAREIHRQC